MNIFDDALLKRFTDSTEAVVVTSLDTLLVYDNETGLVYKVPVSVLTAAFAASSPVQSVAGKTGTVLLAKTDVGLTNVDNTADSTKSVSYADISGTLSPGVGVTGTKTIITSITVTNGLVTAWS